MHRKERLLVLLCLSSILFLLCVGSAKATCPPVVNVKLPYKMDKIDGLYKFFANVKAFEKEHPPIHYTLKEKLHNLEMSVLHSVKQKILDSTVTPLIHAKDAIKDFKKTHSLASAGKALVDGIDELMLLRKDVGKAVTLVEKLHVMSPYLTHIFEDVFVKNIPVLGDIATVADMVGNFIDIYVKYKQDKELENMQKCVEVQLQKFDMPLVDLYSYSISQGDQALITMAVSQAFSIVSLGTSIAIHAAGIPAETGTAVSIASTVVQKVLHVALTLPSYLEVRHDKKIIDEWSKLKLHDHERVSKAMKEIFDKDSSEAGSAYRFLKYCISHKTDRLCGTYFKYEFSKYGDYITELAHMAVGYNHLVGV